MCAKAVARPARKKVRSATAKTRIKLYRPLDSRHVNGIVSGDSWNDVAKGIELIGSVLAMSPQQAKRELAKLQAHRKH